MKAKDMSEHTPEMSVDLAREIARQGEVRLQAIMTLATAADLRATTLCGIFGAASVGLGAAVLAYLGAAHPSMRLVVSGAVSSIIFLLASGTAAFAGAPRSFYVPGGDPDLLRVWSWDNGRWRDEREMLEGTLGRYSKSIEENASLLENCAKFLKASLWVALVAIVAAVASYLCL